MERALDLRSDNRWTNPALYCLACGGVTAGRKPFCAKHIGRMPYVKALLKELQRGKKPARRGKNVA